MTGLAGIPGMPMPTGAAGSAAGVGARLRADGASFAGLVDAVAGLPAGPVTDAAGSDAASATPAAEPAGVPTDVLTGVSVTLDAPMRLLVREIPPAGGLGSPVAGARLRLLGPQAGVVPTDSAQDSARPDDDTGLLAALATGVPVPAALPVVSIPTAEMAEETAQAPDGVAVERDGSGLAVTTDPVPVTGAAQATTAGGPVAPRVPGALDDAGNAGVADDGDGPIAADAHPDARALAGPRSNPVADSDGADRAGSAAERRGELSPDGPVSRPLDARADARAEPAPEPAPAAGGGVEPQAAGRRPAGQDARRGRAGSGQPQPSAPLLNQAVEGSEQPAAPAAGARASFAAGDTPAPPASGDVHPARTHAGAPADAEHWADPDAREHDAGAAAAIAGGAAAGGDRQPGFGTGSDADERNGAGPADAGRTRSAFGGAAPAPPAGHAPAAPAARSAAAEPMPARLTGEVGEQVTSQIVQSLRTQVRGGIGEAVVRLKPEYLGEVTITVRVESGRVEASIKAALPAVREWIEGHEPTLRQGLGEHGLSLGRLRVEPDGERAFHDADRHEPPSHGRQPRPRQPRPSGAQFELIV
ncbi:MAG: flagellar hook-length control protein FliK [Vicinamibacterales bacterium]